MIVPLIVKASMRAMEAVSHAGVVLNVLLIVSVDLMSVKVSLLLQIMPNIINATDVQMVCLLHIPHHQHSMHMSHVNPIYV